MKTRWVHTAFIGVSLRSVMSKAPNYDIVVSEFELLEGYYIHFQNNMV